MTVCAGMEVSSTHSSFWIVVAVLAPGGGAPGALCIEQVVPRAGLGAGEKDFFPLPAIGFRILDPPACCLVTMSTELSWLTSEFKYEERN
jgi:hypothetical protein